MTRTATLIAVASLMAGAAVAQPSRTADGNLKDAIWARDVGAAIFSLDGALTEPEWAQAQSIKLSQDGSQPIFLPGGGAAGRDAFNGTAPPDPGQAIVKFLRKGNTLYIGADVNDKSIGGRRDFFAADGFVLALLNRTLREQRSFPNGEPNTNVGAASNMSELIYSWANVGPSATPVGSDTVGIKPSLKGNLFNPTDGVVAAETMMKANSISNDDRNGTNMITPDTGYTMEIRIDLGALGYDFTQGDGDRMAFAVAFYDLDYNWPVGQTDLYQGRAWWQSFFANNLNEGTAFLYGSPSVTVSSGAVPTLNTAELQIPAVVAGQSIAVDGQLNETAWTTTAPQVSLQYRPELEFVDKLPSIGPYYNGWFRPDGGVAAADLPPLVDKTVGKFRFIHQGSTLYVGLDTDDQAVSGRAQQGNEARYDGFRLTIRDITPDAADNYIAGNRLPSRQFTVVIDSMGVAQLRDDARDEPYASSIKAGAFLKGTGTAGNSTDIDSGYQLEMSLDLSVLGFDTTNRLIWIGANYFDGDDLDVDANSYGTRAWWLTERAQGPTARVYLNPTLFTGSTADENGPDAARTLRALGAAPNPSAGVTSLRYQLATSADVTVEVFDVLGRQVGRVDVGRQSAGTQQVPFDVSALSTGAYVYRVRTSGGETATGRLQVVR